VLTNDRWNQSMLQIGAIAIRESVEPFDAPYAVPFAGGGALVASRIVSSDQSSDLPLLGPVISALDSAALAAIEDRLCEFLQLPALFTPSPHVPGPLGDASRYPVWGQIYRAGLLINGERKRRLVVSPNAWNAVSELATLVRTTTSFARYGDEFPQIQRGAARACCGDAITFEHSSVRLARRDRPSPHTATMPDMIAVGRGLMAAYELADAVRRLSP
jgi:hypothetical protein